MRLHLRDILTRAWHAAFGHPMCTRCPICEESCHVCTVNCGLECCRDTVDSLMRAKSLAEAMGILGGDYEALRRKADQRAMAYQARLLRSLADRMEPLHPYGHGETSPVRIRQIDPDTLRHTIAARPPLPVTAQAHGSPVDRLKPYHPPVSPTD